MNLSAPFLCEVPPFFESMIRVLEYSELLFGNETEAAAFAKAKGWTAEATAGDVKAIAKRIADEIPFRGPEGHKGRTVVLTQGKEPVIVVQGKGGRIGYCST